MKIDSVTIVDARAVDVGYFNVKYTLGRQAVGDRKELAAAMFPSFAPVLKSGVVRRAGHGAVAQGGKLTSSPAFRQKIPTVPIEGVVPEQVGSGRSCFTEAARLAP